MTGSGGSRGDGFPSSGRGGALGGGSVSGKDQCDIVQRAPLNSPKPAIVATISAGDILRVHLNSTGDRPILEVVAAAGVAGALTHIGHLKLIECIQLGRVYQAVVTTKVGGAVELRIEPA